MKKSTKALVLLLAIGAVGSAAASDIYQWTDEDGNTQYGDRPSEGSVRVTDIESHPTDNSRILAAAEARQVRQTDAAETAAAAAAANPGPSAQELRAEAADRAEKCDTYRSRLQKLITSRRLYRQDEDGERVYLSDDEMQTAREKVENQVADYCSS